MAVIATGRFNRGVQKALGIKGEIVIPDLDSALQAGYDITDAATDPAHVDTHVLFGWQRFFRAFDITGDATHPGSASWGIPGLAVAGTSPIIAVVERWVAWVPVADMQLSLSLEVGLSASHSPALAPFDSRSSKKSIAGIITSAVRNPGGQLIGSIPASSQGATLALVELVAPGQPGMCSLNIAAAGPDSWTIATLGNTARIFGGVWWRERALDPAEVSA